MPVGRPDWYNVGQSNVVDTMSDMAELAVRLGSCVNFDRSGKTIYYDQFNRLDGLYKVSNSGALSGFAHSTDYAEYGGGSVHCQLPADVTKWCHIIRSFRMWGGSKFSFEMAFACNYRPQQVVLYFDTYYQGVHYQPRLLLKDDWQTLQYYNQYSSWQSFATPSTPAIDTNMYNLIRYTWDIESKFYDTVQINDTLWDLGVLGLYTTTTTQVNHFAWAFDVYGNAGNIMDFYLDRLIISEDY